MKNYIIYLLFIILLFPNNFNYCLNFNKSILPTASKGILDLTKIDIDKSGIIPLKGEWEFYWNTFIESNQLSNIQNYLKDPEYINIPNNWNNFNYKGIKLPGYGFGILRLIIYAESNKLYSIKLNEINTAYILWVNRKYSTGSGKPGKTEKEMIPSWKRNEIVFYSDKNEIELLLLISNFKHRKGGLETVPLFGSYFNIINLKTINIGFELFIVGILTIVAIYHLILFFKHKKENFSLVFSIINFLIILRVLLTGEKQLISWFPNFNWELAVKLEYLSYYISTPLFLLFFYYVIENFIHKILLKFSLLISFIFIILIILTPTKVFSHSIIYYHIFTLIITFYIFTKLLKFSLKNNNDAKILLFGFIFLIITLINDILNNLNIINTNLIFPAGMLIFLLTQAHLLSMRFLESFKKVEELTNELDNKNKMLEKWNELLQEKSEEKIKMLLKALDDCAESVVITDSSGNIEYVNKKFTQLTGYSYEEVLGKNPRILKSGLMKEEIYKELWNFISNGYEWHGEFLNKKKNGELYWESVSIAPIKNNLGIITNYIAIKEDITEKKKIQSELDRKNNELSRWNKRMESQLDIARKIQIKLLPSTPPLPNISVFYKPMEKIGGDFYDFLKFRDKNLIGFFISDVAGHGVPAALIAAMIKSLILQNGEVRKSPAKMLRYLNEILIEQTKDMFITALYGILNIRNNNFTFSCAGHNPPYIIENNKIYPVNIKNNSPPLAVIPNYTLETMGINYRDETITLKRNSKLLLYTDGLVETIPINDISEKDFEKEKLLKILSENINLKANELINKISDELIKFRGSNDFDDDICIVCVDI